MLSFTSVETPEENTWSPAPELGNWTIPECCFGISFFVEDHLRSEKMPQAGSKRVTWAVCCFCLSTKLTLPAPMVVPGAEPADCQLPGTVLSRLLCQINVDLHWRSLEYCLSLPFKHVLLFCFLQIAVNHFTLGTESSLLVLKHLKVAMCLFYWKPKKLLMLFRSDYRIGSWHCIEAAALFFIVKLQVVEKNKTQPQFVFFAALI